TTSTSAALTFLIKCLSDGQGSPFVPEFHQQRMASISPTGDQNTCSDRRRVIRSAFRIGKVIWISFSGGRRGENRRTGNLWPDHSADAYVADLDDRHDVGVVGDVALKLIGHGGEGAHEISHGFAGKTADRGERRRRAGGFSTEADLDRGGLGRGAGRACRHGQ